MNDRVVTAAGALLALLIMLMLLYQPAAEVEISRPVSADRGQDGYMALHRWLELSAVSTLSLRTRWTDLHEQPELPLRGNLMISTMPHLKPMRARERFMLDYWISQGNTLLVLAALNDSPDWILATSTDEFLEQLGDLTGLDFGIAIDEKGEAVTVGELLEETGITMSPIPEHPLMSGVKRLQGVSDSISNIWEPDLSEPGEFVARLAFEQETGLAGLWQIPRGEGHIILSASGSLMANRMLGEADNARFLANLVAYHLGPEGVVVFDDYHQGMSELYDPEAFYADERLHTSIRFLLAFWLLYMVGGSGRLVRYPPARPATRQGDLVQAMGGFISRKLDRTETARVMIDNWLREMERNGQLRPGGGSPWQQLENMSLVEPGLLQALEADYACLGRGEKIDLQKLHLKLQAMKRSLA